MTAEGHKVASLHGAKDSVERDAIIDRFRDGKEKVLITTNVIARGIDISQVNMVVNYDLPLMSDRGPGTGAHDMTPDVETYIHRIGAYFLSLRFGHRHLCFSLWVPPSSTCSAFWIYFFLFFCFSHSAAFVDLRDAETNIHLCLIQIQVVRVDSDARVSQSTSFTTTRRGGRCRKSSPSQANPLRRSRRMISTQWKRFVPLFLSLSTHVRFCLTELTGLHTQHYNRR